MERPAKSIAVAFRSLYRLMNSLAGILSKPLSFLFSVLLLMAMAAATVSIFNWGSSRCSSRKICNLARKILFTCGILFRYIVMGFYRKPILMPVLREAGKSVWFFRWQGIGGKPGFGLVNFPQLGCFQGIEFGLLFFYQLLL